MPWSTRRQLAKAARSRDLESAWVEFAEQYTWDWYCTLTTDPKRGGWGEERCLRELNRWLRSVRAVSFDHGRWHRQLSGHYGTRAEVRTESQPYAICALEHPESNIHWHCIVGGLEPGTNRRLARFLWHTRCGFAKVLPFDQEKGGGRYLFKYASKGDHIETWGLLSADRNIQRLKALL